MVQDSFQSRTGGGLGRGVGCTGGKETRTKDDAQTNKGCGFHEITISAEAQGNGAPQHKLNASAVFTNGFHGNAQCCLTAIPVPVGCKVCWSEIERGPV